jgi:hypothetical protein
MWLLSLLVFSALASYLCVSSITSYYDRETVSKITVFQETPMEFPAITFCNLSPFQTNFSFEVLHAIIQNTTKYFESPQRPYGKILVANRYYFMSNIYDIVKNSDKLNLSNSLESMLKVCIYDLSNLCFLSDFECYYDFYYGNCFRFNSKGDKKLEQIDSLIILLSKFYKLKTYEECNCPFECNSNSYTLSTSFSTFSNDAFSFGSDKNSFEEAHQETLALNVYFDELKYTIIDEKIKTNLIDLLANIGGMPLSFFYSDCFLSKNENI